MIPDEAVEAAARCFPGYDPDLDGDEIDRAENNAFRARARQILEAAAPHLTNTPAEQAMADIETHLERWFNGEQTQTAAMAAVSRISGAYKMESIK